MNPAARDPARPGRAPAPPALGYAAWSSATPSRCAGSPCPCCPPGTRRCGCCTSRDLHLHAAPATQDRVGARRWPRSSPTSSSTPATTSPHRDAVPAAAARRWSRCWSVPGVFVLGLQRLLRADARRTRRATSRRAPREATGTDVAAAHRRPRRGASRAAAGSTSPTAAPTLDVGGHELEFVGVDDPHLDYDRYADGRRPPPTRRPPSRSGVTHAPYQRVLDAMTADGAGLVLAGHTHGGQLALPVLRRPGHQLRPRHRPGQGRLALVAGRRTARRRPSRARTTRPGCTSRPGSAPRPTRRCASPAGPRRRC